MAAGCSNERRHYVIAASFNRTCSWILQASHCVWNG